MRTLAKLHPRVTITLCMVFGFLLVCHPLTISVLQKFRDPVPASVSGGDVRRSLKEPNSTGVSKVLLQEPSTGNLTWKTVLFWDRWFGSDWSERFTGTDSKSLLEEGCPSWRCRFTYDRSQLQAAHALLLRAQAYPWRSLPARREPLEQRWVLVDVEAPPERAAPSPGLRQASALINWTMTYHSHSDVLAFYGYFLSHKASGRRTLRPNLMWEHQEAMEQQRAAVGRGANLTEVLGPVWRSLVNKTRVVAWMSSHCRTRSRREEYIAQLEKYLPVDKYGTCGGRACHKKSPYGTGCWENVLHKYSFYLAMENSLCDEYVTEKLYNPLVYGIVPVVWGGADYSWFLPPHSYINARHYHPKELAALLLSLHQDPVAYGRYHVWRAYLVPVVRGSMCELCHRLHEDVYHSHHYNIPAARHARGKCMTLPTPLFSSKHNPDAWRTVITTNYTESPAR